MCIGSIEKNCAIVKSKNGIVEGVMKLLKNSWLMIEITLIVFWTRIMAGLKNYKLAIEIN